MTSTTLTGANANNDFNPFGLGCYGMPSSGTGAGSYSGIYNDYYSAICSCYAYARGSVRIGMSKWTNVNTRVVTKVYMPTDLTTVAYYSAAQAGGAQDNMQLIAHHNFDQNNSFTEVRVQAYGQLPTRLNKFIYNSNVATNASYDAYVPRVRLVFSQSDTTGNAYFFRSVGDDFQLGYFIGCPPIYVSEA